MARRGEERGLAGGKGSSAIRFSLPFLSLLIFYLFIYFFISFPSNLPALHECHTSLCKTKAEHSAAFEADFERPGAGGEAGGGGN